MNFLKRIFISYTFSIMLSVWVILFLLFCLVTLSLKYTALQPADAVVVLTGGKDHRIQAGIHLLEEKWADTMFISGVNKIVKAEDILGSDNNDLKSIIHLGYMAENTHTNALEITQWAKEHNIHSIILVTSFYHMPRSLLEMKGIHSGLKITPYSIFPKEFNESTQWIHTKYAWHLFTEYHKFIATFVKNLIKG